MSKKEKSLCFLNLPFENKGKVCPRLQGENRSTI